MATITVRNLDDGVRDALRHRGSVNGRSMESEAREILSAAVAAPTGGGHDLVRRVHALFGDLDPDVPERVRDEVRDLPDAE